MKPGATGFRRVVDATGYTIKGLRAAWRVESAFRQETVLALLFAPAAFWLGRSLPETAMLLATLAFVLATELLNSAIEAIVDRASPELNELAGRAKDMGSAAVFVSLSTVVVVWTLVAIDRFG
ncbi:MAG TPA: diacylglycerol kinase [Pseudomonadales bacterium]|nr:diacylglycerol kinase [Pseudomonadales bacterium]